MNGCGTAVRAYVHLKLAHREQKNDKYAVVNEWAKKNDRAFFVIAHKIRDV